MTSPNQSDMLLIGRIRDGQPEAWDELIARYEGRLLAYVEGRTRDRAAAEDVVQEAFVGFLVSLPNYDVRRPLESYLFSIAAHKLTDHLRRQGRRPALPLVPEGQSDASGWEPAGRARAPSSIARSSERRHLERRALVAALAQQIDHWRRRGQWRKLICAELLFLRGWPNNEVARRMGISEQTVANYKYEFLDRLRGAIRKQGLPEDVFPELYQQD
jgi:RNA polymerase sigma-70 factor (ECF subfamily)